MIISTKLYSPGDVVIEHSSPDFSQLLPEFRGKRCETCFKEDPSLKSCSGCHVSHYCGKECQREDWKSYHKHGECKLFSELKTRDLLRKIGNEWTFLFTTRIYLTLQSRPELAKKEYQLPNGTTKTFVDLMTNEENIMSEKGPMLFFNVFMMLSSIFDKFDMSRWRIIHGKINTNAISLNEPGVPLVLATALNINTSFFNHSCRPNVAIISCHVHRKTARAMTQISPGDELTITYIENLLASRESRRAILRQRWYFDCQCIRCSNPDNDESLLKEISILDTKRKDPWKSCEAKTMKDSFLLYFDLKVKILRL